ncbi:hypothetical protein HETIRDRAFT_165213 [Heterobasidion irregulare TC 32-1]|uniref:Uncharacterized protein n=1 Tax=Heterobasidion irregulare (strain TC 32-1) TaxID=747525 RepID=W4KAK0_HETIT|nr:uncharacterized protein HETIRDRAFT_165213 [Heterobasidion irregulare TC 32-1]ETW82385.1 hypothetical protein HETIRDRAFT_165213 [Heterobasidion irregulare TC 32-1]
MTSLFRPQNSHPVVCHFEWKETDCLCTQVSVSCRSRRRSTFPRLINQAPRQL